MTLMDKINQFESLRTQTVEKFNEIFNRVPLKDFAGNLEVEIGELHNSDTTRFLIVGSTTVSHKFSHEDEANEEEF